MKRSRDEPVSFPGLLPPIRSPGYYWVRFEGSDAPFIAFWSKNTREWLLVADVDPVYDGPGVIVLSAVLKPPKF